MSEELVERDPITICVNISIQADEYFKEHDLSQVVNVLLEMYDITSVPKHTYKDRVQRRVTVWNDLWLDLYNKFGPRYHGISIARLIEFAYLTDVLALERFKGLKKTEAPPKNFTLVLIRRVYKNLLDLQKQRPNDMQLKQITEIVYNYMEVIADEKS